MDFEIYSKFIKYGVVHQQIWFCFVMLTWRRRILSHTSYYVFYLGVTAISWRSKLQGKVALSTTEAEYVAVSEDIKGKDMAGELARRVGVQSKKFCSV